MKRLIGIILCFSFSSYGVEWQTIPGKLRYDQVCYLISHNSYASAEYGYVYAQQNLSIEKQLALGVRGLKFSAYVTRGQVLLCHKSPSITRFICRGKDPMPLDETFSIIKTFLNENPDEVLTLFLELYGKVAPEVIDTPFKESGLDKYILNPSDWQDETAWPTLEWMRTYNKRLVIFNQLGETDLCFNRWHHVAENQWGTLHPVKACNERPESKKHRTKKRALYLLNYFPTFKLNFDKAYEKINTHRVQSFLQRILEHGLSSGSNNHLLPTFLSLDFVDIGNGIEHVMKINEQRQSSITIF